MLVDDHRYFMQSDGRGEVVIRVAGMGRNELGMRGAFGCALQAHNIDATNVHVCHFGRDTEDLIEEIGADILGFESPNDVHCFAI